MKSRVFAGAILVLALLLSGCGDGGSEPRPGDTFIGGVVGLNPLIMDGMPPPTVADSGTETFSFGVALENVGESNVGPGSENPFIAVRLSGIRPDDFSLTKEDLATLVEEYVPGARKNFDGTILPGGTTVAIFQDLSFQHRVHESELFTLNAEICYDYSNHATLKVCIKDDILEHAQDATLCRLRDGLEPRNSGGPLHVLEADQNPRGDDKIQINFVVQNMGSGIFFNRAGNSLQDSCSFDTRNPNMYKALVVVNPVDPANYELECNRFDNQQHGFENIAIDQGAEYTVLRMGDNRPRSLTCFLEKASDVEGRVFQDLLEIEIYYRYGEFLQVPVLIQNANTIDRTKVPDGRAPSGGSSGPGGDDGRVGSQT